MCVYCLFYCYGDHRVLHVLTHSFPTRRSSDLGNTALNAKVLRLILALVPLGAFVLAIAILVAAGPGIVGLGFGLVGLVALAVAVRSEEHTSELQSLMRISYAVFCLNKKKIRILHTLLYYHLD